MLINCLFSEELNTFLGIRGTRGTTFNVTMHATYSSKYPSKNTHIPKYVWEHVSNQRIYHRWQLTPNANIVFNQKSWRLMFMPTITKRCSKLTSVIRMIKWLPSLSLWRRTNTAIANPSPRLIATINVRFFDIESIMFEFRTCSSSSSSLATK